MCPVMTIWKDKMSQDTFTSENHITDGLPHEHLGAKVNKP